jgi:hypothetical protein
MPHTRDHADQLVPQLGQHPLPSVSVALSLTDAWVLRSDTSARCELEIRLRPERRGELNQARSTSPEHAPRS